VRLRYLFVLSFCKCSADPITNADLVCGDTHLCNLIASKTQLVCNAPVPKEASQNVNLYLIQQTVFNEASLLSGNNAINCNSEVVLTASVGSYSVEAFCERAFPSGVSRRSYHSIHFPRWKPVVSGGRTTNHHVVSSLNVLEDSSYKVTAV
jgi:hypothetical protein